MSELSSWNFSKKDTESVFDLFILRPLAKYCMPFFIKSSMTPNQVTLFAFLCGVFSTACFVFNLPPWFSGIIYLLVLVFDCVDGQLARATGQETPLGPLFDGLGDYSMGTILMLGILVKSPSEYSFVILFGFLFCVIQNYTFDIVKNKYLLHVGQSFKDSLPSFKKARKMLLESWSEKKVLTSILNLILLMYFFLPWFFQYVYVSYKRSQPFQKRYKKIGKKKREAYAEAYLKTHQPIIRLWTLMNYSSTAFFVVIAFFLEAFFHKSVIYVFYIFLIPGNIFLIYLILLKYRAQKQIKAMIYS